MDSRKAALLAGIRYPDLTERVIKIIQGISALGLTVSSTYVNATGHGSAVADLLEERLSSETVVPVFFNHGDRRTKTEDGVSLGKAKLVSRLQLLLQTSRLHLPKNADTQTLAKELTDYEIKLRRDANERYGAFQVGTRDELVTALGLATQVDHPDEISVWDLADYWGPVESLLS